MPSIVVGICVGNDVGRRPMTVTVPRSRLGSSLGASARATNGSPAAASAAPSTSLPLVSHPDMLDTILGSRPPRHLRPIVAPAAPARLPACAKIRTVPQPPVTKLSLVDTAGP